MVPELLTTVLILVFALSHSILATQYVKNRIPLSQRDYRLFYVIIAVISLIVLEFFVGILAEDSQHIQIDPIILPTNDILQLTNFLSIFGVLIVAGAVLQSSPLKFLGLKAENYEKDLRTGIFYRFSRHPMYFGALLMFIPIIFIMDNLVLIIKYFGYSSYFVIGAVFEEQRMKNIFPNYDIMYSRGFLFPWKLSHLKVLFSRKTI